jgi:hypothetical protein
MRTQEDQLKMLAIKPMALHLPWKPQVQTPLTVPIKYTKH